MPNILAVAESRGGELRRVAFEAVTAARALANGGEVHAIVFGAPGIAAKAAALGEYGASTVHVCEDASFANYAPETMAATIAALTTGGGYRVVVLSARPGRIIADVTPQVSHGQSFDEIRAQPAFMQDFTTIWQLIRHEVEAQLREEVTL